MRKEDPCIVFMLALILFKNAIAFDTFLSSVGRALLLHGRCRWFESSRKDKLGVSAGPARVCKTSAWWFDSICSHN